LGLAETASVRGGGAEFFRENIAHSFSIYAAYSTNKPNIPHIGELRFKETAPKLAIDLVNPSGVQAGGANRALETLYYVC